MPMSHEEIYAGLNVMFAFAPGDVIDKVVGWRGANASTGKVVGLVDEPEDHRICAGIAAGGDCVAGDAIAERINQAWGNRPGFAGDEAARMGPVLHLRGVGEA